MSDTEFANTLNKRLVLILAFVFFIFTGRGEAYGEDIITPSHSVKDYCMKSGCDYQIFYSYFYENKLSYCAARKHINSNRRQNALRHYVAGQVESSGLPASVGLIPMLESSFSIGKKKGAKQHRAAGLWQFLPETGRDMGLIINRDVDERYDMQKSTEAGIRYVKWLVTRFNGDINLAILSYHAGVGRIEKLIENYQTDNPWFLSKLISENFPDKDYLEKFHSYAVVLTTNGCGERQ
ncbi:hypothetical protein BM525_21715 (plasmid) [Alteromonas mediterranea]|uniref:Transglycosylase SLT domain-containing protein n=1 Tax=Alteromonas mediterranea TaxID=314275 RepID=A0AAC9JGY6_9ALTE|nr:transglycosylase SLT domain-containing protein [Alteromonas mediterranea]APD92480.1 hypothetical protein BM524_21495 [Alteromonas mediterranea]APE00341.1 hypothetical protein BM525_21715 [Alteromonas mediterranea]